jgi:hypothetical protein
LLIIYRILQRLPQAVSLILHDNIIFDDALERVQSLQFQQFRQWSVFKTSLKCIFANVSELQKIIADDFVLSSPQYPRKRLTAINWKALIRPELVVQMSILMKTLSIQQEQCSKECSKKIKSTFKSMFLCLKCGLNFHTELRYLTHQRENHSTLKDIEFRNKEYALTVNHTYTSRENNLPQNVNTTRPKLLYKPEPTYIEQIMKDNWTEQQHMKVKKIQAFKQVHVQQLFTRRQAFEDLSKIKPDSTLNEKMVNNYRGRGLHTVLAGNSASPLQTSVW